MANQITSGGNGGAKSSHIQVTFNGKIATPQSLIQRVKTKPTTHTSHYGSSAKNNKLGVQLEDEVDKLPESTPQCRSNKA